MSRQFAAVGVIGAIVVGIFTSYTTFQPELVRQQEERAGNIHTEPNPQDDRAISNAILDDLREARQQVTETSKSGPAWKLRQLLFGPRQVVETQDATNGSRKEG